MLSVRRERNGTVHVANQDARRSAENGRLIQNRNGVFLLIAANEIEIAAIRRKRQTEIARRGRRNDLCVAAGLNVAELQSLQSVLLQNLREILSVRGNRGQRGVPVIGKVFDRKMLVRGTNRFLYQGHDPVGGGEQNRQRNEARNPRGQLVFLCSFNQHRTAARPRGRRF